MAALRDLVASFLSGVKKKKWSLLLCQHRRPKVLNKVVLKSLKGATGSGGGTASTSLTSERRAVFPAYGSCVPAVCSTYTNEALPSRGSLTVSVQEMSYLLHFLRICLFV